MVFGVARELFVLVVRLLGARELYQFHLLKLVLANDAAHVLAVRSGFAAEARRVGGEQQGQARVVDDLVAIEVGDGHFGGGNEVERRCRRAEP